MNASPLYLVPERGAELHAVRWEKKLLQASLGQEIKTLSPAVIIEVEFGADENSRQLARTK
jgi:hypothetical protein